MKKKARRFNLLLKGLIKIFILLAIVAGLFFLWKSDWLKISKLTCRQDGFPCQKEIVEFFDELRGQNIFIASSTNLAKKIEENITTIEDVEIKKELPNKVLIKIISRQPFAAATNDKKTWFLIDEHKFVYKKVFSRPNDLPIIVVNRMEPFFYIKQQIKDEKLIKSLSFIKKLKENFIVFKQLTLSRNETINVFLNEPVIASFSAQKSTTEQVDSLQFILRQSKIEGKMPAFIDLRFDKPVVKY